MSTRCVPSAEPDSRSALLRLGDAPHPLRRERGRDVLLPQRKRGKVGAHSQKTLCVLCALGAFAFSSFAVGGWPSPNPLFPLATGEGGAACVAGKTWRT